jgi:hypothetical protein
VQIRVYSIYLDEAVELYRSTTFDFTGEKASVAIEIRAMSCDKLLNLLPRLQLCQAKLACCLPEGNAIRNSVVLVSSAYALLIRNSKSRRRFSSHPFLSDEEKGGGGGGGGASVRGFHSPPS